MALAIRGSSMSLFTTAAAVVLGIQFAPWPTLMAQAPAPLNVQTQARPISQGRVVSRPTTTNQQFNNPQLNQSAPATAGPTAGKSEVQRELERLYEQNGRTPPEMIDIRQSMATPTEGAGVSQAPTQYQSQPAAIPAAVEPQYQMTQAQAQVSQAQIPVQQVTQTTQAPAQAPAPAPKKKGLFSKLFHREDNTGPTQPPVEPPYTPPVNPQTAEAPVAVQPSLQLQQPQQFQQVPQATPPVQQPAMVPVAPLQPLAQQPTGRPNYGFLFDDEQPAAQAAPPVQQPAQIATEAPAPVPQQPSTNDGFEAPLFVDQGAEATPQGATLPKLDFQAPLPDPASNQVELGEPAPLPVATATPPALTPRGNDPFSEDALFPSQTPAAQPLSVPQANDSKVRNDSEVVANDKPAVPADLPAGESAPRTEDESPYSGLTLDTEAVSTPVAMKPALQVPLSNVTEPNALDQEATPDLAAPPREFTPAPASSTEQDAEPPLVVDQASPPARLTPVPQAGAQRTQAKLEMIAARKGLKGLKGFCPVSLRDHRDLVDAQSQFRVVYNEKTYYLSSSDAVAEFHSDPAKYAPAARGCDVIHLAITGEEQEGSLDHAVWYKGRLYLFVSAETMETFVAAPSSHATLD